MSESVCGSAVLGPSSMKTKSFCCGLRAKSWIQIIVVYQILICGTMLTLGGTGMTKKMLDQWLDLEPIQVDNSMGGYEHYANVYPFTIFRFKPASENEIRVHQQKKQDHLKSKESQ